MKPHSKYLNSVSKLRSICSGPNDTTSQLGDIVKAAKSERIGKRESTKDAIKYSLQNNREVISKMCSTVDKNTGKIEKRDFLRILRTYGIFPNPQAISKLIFPNLLIWFIYF